MARGPRKPPSGVPSNVEKSPAQRQRDARRHRRQSKRWDRKSGPVQTYFVCPICGWDHARRDCPEGDGT